MSAPMLLLWPLKIVTWQVYNEDDTEQIKSDEVVFWRCQRKIQVKMWAALSQSVS